jgi:hypothetical protein
LVGWLSYGKKTDPKMGDPDTTFQKNEKLHTLQKN